MSLAYYDRVDAIRCATKCAWWSAREESRLRALYPRGSWADLRAALPHRSKRAIEQHANKLDIARCNGSKPAWTGAEIKLVTRLYDTATWDELAKAIPRHTVRAIRLKGIQLRLRRPPRTKLQSRYALIRQLRSIRRERRMTCAQLAELIGCCKSRIQFWELGVSVPRLPMLLDWIEALGLKLELSDARLKPRDRTS